MEKATPGVSQNEAAEEVAKETKKGAKASNTAHAQ
jgi:hypothetical protein